MKSVLFDTNIILDIALKRESFYEEALKLFKLIDDKLIVGNITSSTVTDIYYISKKQTGHDKSIKFIRGLVEIVEIIGVDKHIVLEALSSELPDFEDAIQNFAAEIGGIEIILTRNKKDFEKTSLKIFTPTEFLLTLSR